MLVIVRTVGEQEVPKSWRRCECWVQHKSQVAFPSDFMVCTTDSVSYLQWFCTVFAVSCEKALTLMVFLGWDPTRKVSPSRGLWYLVLVAMNKVSS